MSVEATPVSTQPGTARTLSLVRTPRPGLADQQAFAAHADRVLRRAGVSGDRLTTALYLILTEHAPVQAVGGPDGLHLRCSCCRVKGLEPVLRYPCPTARQALCALDAVLF